MLCISNVTILPPAVLTGRLERSIHFIMMPQPNRGIIDKEIERAVKKMQSVVELGRVIRDRVTIPIKVCEQSY